MNQKDENCAAFQMLHLSLLTLIYCKEQNGRKLANNNFTTLAIQQKKNADAKQAFLNFCHQNGNLPRQNDFALLLLSYNKLQ